MQHSGSPLVHIIVTPSRVISKRHMPIVMLQVIIIMPFIIMQQVTMLPFIIVQRFCSMLADIVSSQAHVIFMPPSHISICIVQRGMTIMFIPGAAGMGGFMVMPDIIPGIICRSIVIIIFSPLQD
ncbi:MAG: hypothetical protein JOY92_06095 [Verrucomicrobia bacterium]|nr:hypothetical protein [Verrucomicrobiota bacterium]